MDDHHVASGYLVESLAIFDQLRLDHYAERVKEAISAGHVGILHSSEPAQVAIQPED